MNEEEKVKKSRNTNAKKTLLVKNISEKTLHLESGKMKPGDEGVVTPSELSNFINLFEVLL